MTEKKPTYTVDDARALIVEENKRKSSACWNEIQVVLDKHGCTLDAAPVFNASPAGYVVNVQIWVKVRED